jgi:hypothetical protein
MPAVFTHPRAARTPLGCWKIDRCLAVWLDHFNAGILTPGIAPIIPKVCKIQINTTTNTTILSKLLIAPAIGM